MKNFAKRTFWSALHIICTVKVYRGPEQAPWITTQKDVGQRAQTVHECVDTAIVEGSHLAEGIAKSIVRGWNGGADQ